MGLDLACPAATITITRRPAMFESADKPCGDIDLGMETETTAQAGNRSFSFFILPLLFLSFESSFSYAQSVKP